MGFDLNGNAHIKMLSLLLDYEEELLEFAGMYWLQKVIFEAYEPSK